MTITAVYDEDLVEIIGRIAPDMEIRRASNVEPYNSLPEKVKERVKDKSPLHWWAYMIEEDELLGPFSTRSEALEAEAAFLRKTLMET